MGEEDDPFVADEVVEVDGTLGGLSIKVGRKAAQAKTATHVSMISGCLIAVKVQLTGLMLQRNPLEISYC